MIGGDPWLINYSRWRHIPQRETGEFLTNLFSQKSIILFNRRFKDSILKLEKFENSFLNYLLIDNDWSVLWKITFAFEGWSILIFINCNTFKSEIKIWTISNFYVNFFYYELGFGFWSRTEFEDKFQFRCLKTTVLEISWLTPMPRELYFYHLKWNSNFQHVTSNSKKTTRLLSSNSTQILTVIPRSFKLTCSHHILWWVHLGRISISIVQNIEIPNLSNLPMDQKIFLIWL